MSDTYQSFQELASIEKEGVNFTIELQDRGTDFVIVGLHGGQIEPGTEIIVRRIAQEDISYYLFLGTARHQHITSSHFDELRCLKIISKSNKVISIHGKKGEGEFIMLGGLDKDLIDKATYNLQKLGFALLPPEPSVEGIQEENICNRGLSGKGLQIELSRGLRNSFLKDEQKLNVFINTIRELVQ